MCDEGGNGFYGRPDKTPIDVKSCWAVPTIDLTDAEHAAVTAAIRRTIEEDRFPHAPCLEPLVRGTGNGDTR
jgi:hypothetical protein